MTTARWSADRFFWAVLDAPGVRAGQLPEGLRQLLQEDLPISGDQLHAVATSTADGKLLVCAAQRAELGDVPESCLTLCPEELPEPLVEAKIDPASLNLFVGEFEPRELRCERAKRRTLAALTVAALACLASVGMVRRAEAWNHAGQEARSAAWALGTTPAALHVELEKLRQAPRSDAKAVSSPDAALALASLLALWPKELECQTDSVTVGPTTMTLSLTVAKDARPFLSSLKPPEGWTLDEPRLTTIGDGARLNLVLRRREVKS